MDKTETTPTKKPTRRDIDNAYEARGLASRAIAAGLIAGREDAARERRRYRHYHKVPRPIVCSAGLLH